jgi:hypothetical protein
MKNRRIISLISALTLILSTGLSSVAQAAIIFQDDTFADVDSEGIIVDSNNTGTDIKFQLGNDGTDGTLTWIDLTSIFQFNNTVDVQGGLSANGDVNFSSSTSTRVRETATVVNGTTACTNIGEVIVQTSNSTVYVCTSAALDTWKMVGDGANAATLNGLTSSQFLRSDTNSALTSGTLTTNAGTILDVNGAADFSGATSLIVPVGANPLTCSVGQVNFNTGDSILYYCSAANTWTSVTAVTFEAVYGADADKTLTTTNNPFAINAGTSTVGVTANGGVTLNSTGTIQENGGILDFNSTAAFTIDGAASSSITTTGATSDLSLTAGREILFDDSHLAAAIKLSNGDTALNATFTAGDGIIDAINSLASTTAGEGASNIGTNATFTNFTAATPDVEAALVGINTAIGAVSGNNGVLIFAPEYPDTVIDHALTGNGRLDSQYDAAEGNSYYWTTRRGSAQNLVMKFKTPLPTDFVTTGNLTLRYKTGNATVGDNTVTVQMKDSAGTSCGTSAASASAAWATLTVAPAGCTLTASSVVEFIVTLMDATNAAGTNASVGKLSLAYS